MLSDQTSDRPLGAISGAYIADALAMPVHWYYNVTALDQDYGRINDFLPPRNPHPDSILWRSQHNPRGKAAEILHEQAQYWGRRGVHYHQFLQAGENTLNLQLGLQLLESLQSENEYDSDDYLERYIRFMQTPGSHRDTYIEEYHRHFFNNLATGRAPRKCGVRDIHIGGLAHVPILAAWYCHSERTAREMVGEHVQLTHRSKEVREAADAFVRILHDVFQGKNLRSAIEQHGNHWVAKSKMERWQNQPDRSVIGKILSPACYIDDAFPASLYLAWKYANDFEAGVLANAMIGGDNCHRGVVVGALLGAHAGLSRIPHQWKQKLFVGKTILELANMDTLRPA